MLAMIVAAALVSPDAPAARSDPGWVPVWHAGGVLLGMRLAASAAWPAAYDPTAFADEGRHLREAFTRPPDFRPQLGLLRSDGDPWAINAFGHGAYGSEIYLRFRQCGSGAAGALAATAVGSTVWEYAIEGPYKRPSAIDLVWTPLVGGLVLGEARFWLHRWLSAGAPGTARHALRIAVDPFGELERAWLSTRC